MTKRSDAPSSVGDNGKVLVLHPTTRCMRCGTSTVLRDPLAPWSVPDDWRVIWDVGATGPDLHPRPDTIDLIVPISQWVILCPACLPPMGSLTVAEQRYLFSPVVRLTGLVRADPWGPVRPGVALPCPARMRRADGTAGAQCVDVQDHGGRHTNGTNRTWPDEDCWTAPDTSRTNGNVQGGRA